MAAAGTAALGLPCAVAVVPTSNGFVAMDGFVAAAAAPTHCLVRAARSRSLMSSGLRGGVGLAERGCIAVDTVSVL
jgi:hypothetical protein